MNYWTGVASKDHVLIGIKEGIMQLGHGKKTLLSRLARDDWLIYYSPVYSLNPKKSLQAFTAIGQVADNIIYQVELTGDFKPYRRKVNYLFADDAPIRPLIDKLEFIKSKLQWGYAFRYGLVKISESDFNIIKAAMIKS